MNMHGFPRLHARRRTRKASKTASGWTVADLSRAQRGRPLTILSRAHIVIIPGARFYAKQARGRAYGARERPIDGRGNLGESRHAGDHLAALGGSGSALRGARRGFPASSRNKLPAVPLLSRTPRHAAFTPMAPAMHVSERCSGFPRLMPSRESESAEVNICCHNIAIMAKSHRDAIYTWGA